MLQYISDSSKEIDLNRTDKSKKCEICDCNYFSNGFKFD